MDGRGAVGVHASSVSEVVQVEIGRVEGHVGLAVSRLGFIVDCHVVAV